MPAASTAPSGVGWRGVLKKVCMPLTRAQPQGQVKRELSDYLPTEPAQPAGKEGVGPVGESGGEESWRAK